MIQARTGKARPTDKQAESSYSISVRAPYCLDLTVNVLRRLSTNLVDVRSPDGSYFRLLGDVAEVAVVRVCQPNPATLTSMIEGDGREHLRLLAPSLGPERGMLYSTCCSGAWRLGGTWALGP